MSKNDPTFLHLLHGPYRAISFFIIFFYDITLKKEKDKAK